MRSLVPLKARGVTSLRLDHSGKDLIKGQRGSSAKDGDVDTVWRLDTTASPVRLKLHREKSRSGHGPGDLEVTRLSEPLRHDLSASPTAKLAATLDKLSVPADAGRDSARTAVKAAGVQASNDDRRFRGVLGGMGQHKNPLPKGAHQNDTYQATAASPAQSAA